MTLQLSLALFFLSPKVYVNIFHIQTNMIINSSCHEDKRAPTYDQLLYMKTVSGFVAQMVSSACNIPGRNPIQDSTGFPRIL